MYVPENGQDVIPTNDNISNNEIDHFAYSYDNGSIFKHIVEPLNHVHNIIEPSALDVSNPSESNTAAIDSSPGVQSSVQLPSVRLSFQLPSVQLQSVSTTICPKTKKNSKDTKCFHLYRKNKQPDVVAQNKNFTNAESKIILKYDHPDYAYQPKKPGTKKPRKLSKSRDSMITAIAESTFAENPQLVDKISISFMQRFDSGSVENFHTNRIMEMVVKIMEMVEMVEPVLY
ncbi:28217_t:CDS:2 [Gigaspora margarita]|uniref:28217_t:CDS:1 n=1 Tax=Gigaspora margarita TaxID=4874 RepID=A0ABN7UKD5_GIGMA|nr:28217_t:CDS:2 [Gigaspora margarita]